MPNYTLALPAPLREAMRRHPEVRWTEVMRRALQTELERLDSFQAKLAWMDKALADSQLTEEDAVRLGREINRRAAQGLARRRSTKG